ncbi:hypothetical protein [Acinetobacter junii]|uniref:hypothetical protein n=1 Tax=Acinetobacter junii TaxID=40215 RepID=UPI001FB2B823|nr:hypothetical protein [Acinetobacter junii]UOB51285.1 hypothetical protein MRY16_09050 [Acinetobacter junii]
MAKKKVHYGVCLYCEEHKELQRSHSINRSIFRSLLKACGDTNAARVISSSSNIVKSSNDNWTDRLMCSSCESYFNRHFDDYGVHALRGETKGITILETRNSVIYQNIDTTRIILYILSLYWRGSASNHPAYKYLKITGNVNYNLRLILKSREWNFKFISIKISVLFDSIGALDSKTIKQFMVTPFSRKHGIDNTFSFYFLFEGFFIEIFFGKMRHSYKKKGSWIAPSVMYMKCDKVDLHSINALHPVFAQMFKAKRYMELHNIPIK